MSQRIYLVGHGDSQHLVRATSQAVARSHVAKSTISVFVATTDDVYRLAKSGAAVEETSNERQMDLTLDPNEVLA